MMNYQLLIPDMLRRAATYFPHKEIITREGEGVHRYTYRDLAGRVNRLCNALGRLGGRPRRPGWHLWVEHLPPPGSVFRAPVDGRDYPYRQHPPGPR